MTEQNQQRAPSMMDHAFWAVFGRRPTQARGLAASIGAGVVNTVREAQAAAQPEPATAPTQPSAHEPAHQPPPEAVNIEATSQPAPEAQVNVEAAPQPAAQAAAPAPQANEATAQSAPTSEAAPIQEGPAEPEDLTPIQAPSAETPAPLEERSSPELQEVPQMRPASELLRAAHEPSPFVLDLVRCCDAEWRLFREGQIKEDAGDGPALVAKYWRARGEPHTGADTQHPWSAAFISYVMEEAGAGSRFHYSTAHRDYIRKAIRERDDPAAHFHGLRIEECEPRLGDLVCGSWGSHRVTYENALDPGNYASHTDIVIAVRENEIDVMGGNVSASVTKRTIRLLADGKIDPRDPVAREKRLFGIMRNNIIDPGPRPMRRSEA